MQVEPTDMPDQHADSNAGVPRRVHRGEHTAANEQLPKSIWQPGVVKRLADYIKHVREVDKQSDKPHVADQSGKSDNELRHICKLNPGYTCRCPAGVCANDDATYRYARGPYLAIDADNSECNPRSLVCTPEPNKLGNFRCPISGQLCSQTVCREWCESGVDYSKT